MLVKPQLISIKWSSKMKQYYISKGYQFTTYGDVFQVHATDLPPFSDIRVAVICDYCGETVNQPMKVYSHSVAKGDACCGRSACKGKKISRRKTDYYAIDKATIDTVMFSKESPELAYLMGILATDGTVSKRGNRVELTMADRDVIEWVHKFTKCVNPVREVPPRQPQHSLQWRVHFSNKLARNVMEKYGIISNKSLVMRFPELSLNLIPHFVRGVFDGDGTVQYNKKGKGFVSVSIKSGSLAFAVGLKATIERELGFHVTLIASANKKGGEKRYYTVTFTKISSVFRFKEWIYTPNAFSMKRKRNAYESFLRVYSQKRPDRQVSTVAQATLLNE